MTDTFGLDYSQLTDEELGKKQSEAYARLDWASSYGSSGLVGALLRAIEAMEAEERFRASKIASKARAEAFEAPIESDPDLAALEGKHEAPIVEQKPAHQRQTNRRERIQPPAIPKKKPNP